MQHRRAFSSFTARGSASPLSPRLRRAAAPLLVRAFKTDLLLAAPARLPVQLNDAVGSLKVLSPGASIRPDVWTRASRGLSQHQRQSVEEHGDGLRQWAAAYSGQDVQMCEAATDEQRQEAFLFITSRTYNTGKLFGRCATCRASDMAGLYRLKYDAAGMVSHVWQFRTGSCEEVEALLGTEGGGEGSAPWLRDLQLLPCAWAAGPDYAQRKRSAVHVWVDEIRSRNRQERLGDVVAEDVLYIDCLGLQRRARPTHSPRGSASSNGVAAAAPAGDDDDDDDDDDAAAAAGGTPPRAAAGCTARGVSALSKGLRVLSRQFELCEVQLRSLVLEEGGNKAYLHWSQGLTCRVTGRASVVEGASLLVFDADAHVAQMLDFCCPAAVEARLMAAGAARLAAGGQDPEVVCLEDTPSGLLLPA